MFVRHLAKAPVCQLGDGFLKSAEVFVPDLMSSKHPMPPPPISELPFEPPVGLPTKHLGSPKGELTGSDQREREQSWVESPRVRVAGICWPSVRLGFHCLMS